MCAHHRWGSRLFFKYPHIIRVTLVRCSVASSDNTRHTKAPREVIEEWPVRHGFARWLCHAELTTGNVYAPRERSIDRGESGPTFLLIESIFVVVGKKIHTLGHQSEWVPLLLFCRSLSTNIQTKEEEKISVFFPSKWDYDLPDMGYRSCAGLLTTWRSLHSSDDKKMYHVRKQVVLLPSTKWAFRPVSFLKPLRCCCAFFLPFSFMDWFSFFWR